MKNQHKRCKILLSLVLIISLIFIPIAIQANEKTTDIPNITRIYGQSRYETAIKISQEYFEADKGGKVVLATGEDFPDALAAGPLAAYEDAPILLTPKSVKLEVIREEIVRLNPDQIFVVGGTGAISESVVNFLTKDYNHIRLSGGTRFETNEVINKYITEQHEITSTGYVTGMGFPDSLAATPFMLKHNGMITLSTGLSENQSTTNDYIFGGISVLPESNEQQAKRIAGDTRFDTALAVANEGFKDSDTIFVAAGMSFPDALAISAITQKIEAPILLWANGQDKAISEFIDQNNVSNVILVGGSAVNNFVYAQPEPEETEPTEPEETKPVEPEKTKPTETEPVETEPTETEPKDSDVDCPNPNRENWFCRPQSALDKDWEGKIKGNINSQGEKIYHVPNWRNYSKTKIDISSGEKWFSTEREAIEAGWRPDKSYQKAID